MAMYGQGKTRGKVGLLCIEAATNQACAAIITTDKCNPEFLYRHFDLRYDELRFLGRGGNQPNINLSIVKKILVPLPPIKNQDKFVRIINEIEEHKKNIRMVSKETQQLFNSLMSRYFD